MFGKVAIVGPGLIGASIGMALRHGRLAETVVGIGRRSSSLKLAIDVGAIDSATLDVAEGVVEADLVVLATPIGAFEALAPRIAGAMSPGAILTDVASAKVGVIQCVTAALAGRTDVPYVPTHPMAGSEQTGPLAASPDLFRGSVCIVTPLQDGSREAVGMVEDLWRKLGAEVVRMTPAEHDRLVARISHMPHLVAAALMTLVDEETMHYCGGGLRDTTRIAAGRPEIWLDICTSNGAEIGRALGEYADSLRRIRDWIEAGDVDNLRACLTEAKRRRDCLGRRLEKRSG